MGLALGAVAVFLLGYVVGYRRGFNVRGPLRRCGHMTADVCMSDPEGRPLMGPITTDELARLTYYGGDVHNQIGSWHVDFTNARRCGR